MAWAGWLGLGLVLFQLQRLQVRHRQVTVPTLLFWQQAVEESRARVLLHRFRHPWAYLLLWLIAALMWGAVAGLGWNSTPQGQVVLVLDASLEGQAGFEEQKAALLEDAAGFHDRERWVWWHGATLETLLAPSEPLELLAPRLEGRSTDSAPNLLAESLLSRIGDFDIDQELEFRLYGNSELPQSLLDLLPETVRLTRVLPRDPAAGQGAGFLSIGLSEASSGPWDRVDVLLVVRGSEQPPSVRLGADSIALKPVPTSSGQAWLAQDLPCQGQVLEASLPPDSFPADDSARLRLPRRTVRRVAVEPPWLPLFLPVLDADPALEWNDSNPDLVIRSAGSTFAGELPALELASGAQDPTFLLREPLPLGSGEVERQARLKEIHQRWGFAELDGQELAAFLGRAVALELEDSTQRGLTYHAALLREGSPLHHRRHFPVLISASLRWLGQSEEVIPHAEAGRPLPASARQDWVGRTGAPLLRAGLPLAPMSAGLLRTDAGEELEVQAWPGLHLGETAAQLPSSDDDVDLQLPAWTWLLLLALLLLGFEWSAYHRGRMP